MARRGATGRALDAALLFGLPGEGRARACGAAWAGAVVMRNAGAWASWCCGAQGGGDLKGDGVVARLGDGEGFKVHAGRGAGGEVVELAAGLQDEGADGGAADMGLQGGFEIGAEGGEQGRGFDAGFGGEGVRWPVTGGVCGTRTAPAVARMRGQGVHGVPEQAAGEGGEDGEAGARIRARGMAQRVRVGGGAKGVRQHAARAGVEAARPHEGGQGLRGFRVTGATCP